MKFSIGDAVYLKRTGDEGRVAGILSPAMLEVEVDGISFPVYADEVEHPYLRRFTGKTGRPRRDQPAAELPEPEKAPPVRLPQGVYLSFLTEYRADDTVTGAKIHLVNELPHDLRFRYDVRDTRRHRLFSLEGTAYAFGNLYLHDLPWELLAASPRFAWHLVPVYGGHTGPAESGVLRLRPVHLARRMAVLQESGAPIFYERLVDGFLETAPAASLPPLQFQAASGDPLSPGPAALPQEIDLHAEALVGDTAGLRPGEILRLQLDAAHRFLELAAAHDLDTVTVIHGIGTGALRKAVHQLLLDVPGVARFSSDWHPRYGFGAARVWLKKT